MNRIILAPFVILSLFNVPVHAQVEPLVPPSVPDSLFMSMQIVTETYTSAESLQVVGWQDSRCCFGFGLYEVLYSNRQSFDGLPVYYSGHEAMHIVSVYQVLEDFHRSDDMGNSIELPRHTLSFGFYLHSFGPHPADYSNPHDGYAVIEYLENLRFVIKAQTTQDSIIVHSDDLQRCTADWETRRLISSIIEWDNYCVDMPNEVLYPDELYDIDIYGIPSYNSIYPPRNVNVSAGGIPGTAVLKWEPGLTAPEHGVQRTFGFDRSERLFAVEQEQGMQYQYQTLGSEHWETLLADNIKHTHYLTDYGFYHFVRHVNVTGLDPQGQYVFCMRQVNHAGVSDRECDFEPVLPVSIDKEELPRSVKLAQNYPNPFNPVTTITYTLDRSGPVEINVYDLTGRVVSTLVDGVRPAGSHMVRFNSDGLPTRTYVYRLRAGTETLTQTMTLVR